MSRISPSAARNLYLVSYDISNNKLRRKLEKTLKNHGQRIQKSVFLCALAAEQLNALNTTLRCLLSLLSVLQESGDSIVISGPFKEKNVNFLLGNPCVVQSHVIY